MTTIVWDTKVLAGDTRHTVGKHLSPDGPKIFTPPTPTLFNGSPLIAVAGAGNVSMVNGWRDYLFETSRTMGDLKAKMVLHVAFNTPHQSLLILTQKACWKVWVYKFQPHHLDVTHQIDGIGSGARYALPLIQKFGVATAIARAARCDYQTNKIVVLIPHKVGARRRYVPRKELKAHICMERRLWHVNKLPKVIQFRFLTGKT
ncbi:hypothetical protein [Pseudomonas sp. LH1G9]|uniref:hypothetical protein n=1 Tax=Pseudomonas sp. LH1G9 TaxID=2083055 RepID=UPI001319FA9B|nr:hypothetical protein [Pseudomonas sp. LH1G9]